MISACHVQENSQSFPATYDASLPRQDPIYLDANNLYGWSMSQSMPTHGFRFLSKEEIYVLVLKDISDDGEVGYILEVDIHYPHDDYPLAPESLVIDRSMYSPTQQSVFPESASQVKLTSNLQDKVRYAVQYRNLKLYLQSWGYQSAFNESPWLNTDIGFNTRQGSLAGNCSFLKDFFMLMNNSVFGKTQENRRKRVQVELVTDARLLRKRVANRIFAGARQLQIVVQTTVATLTLNRPIYVGFTVLELSKLHMYDFIIII